MNGVGPASLSERQEMAGAYLRAGSAWAVTGVDGSALTDQVLAWITCGALAC